MTAAEFLLDTFHVSGTDIGKFKEAVKKFADATHCKEASVLELPYFAHYAREYDNKEDKAPFFVLSKEALETVNKGGRIQSGYVNRSKLPSKVLMDESGAGNRLFVKFGQFVTFSDLMFGEFMQKGSLSGQGLYIDDLLRNELFVNRLYRRGGKVKFVYREITDPETGKKDAKIFGVMSSKYIYVPQTMVCDVYDKIATGKDFNNPVSREWSIDHGITRIYAEYPDEAKAGLIPGVEIQTSDIGMSSFVVNACIRHESDRRYVIINTVSRIHRGNSESDLDEILQEVDDEIFPELRRYPKLFEELDKPLMPPLLSAADKENQLEMLKDIYKRVFKSMKAGISGKRKKELEKALVNEINPDHEYTWKEIAEQLISVPDRVIGLDDTTSVFQAFRRDMGRAPFLLKDIKDKVVPFEAKEDKELVLA